MAAMIQAAFIPVLAILAAFPALPALAQEDGKLMERAIAQLEAVVRGNPADFKARTLLGRSYWLLGQHEKALEQFRAAAALGDSSAWLLAAEAHLDRAEPGAALAAFESARASLASRGSPDPVRSAEIDLGIARVELVRGNYQRAVEILERVEKGDRQAVNRMRARLLALEGVARAGLVLREGPVAIWTEGARAREWLERSLAVDENDAWVLFALGKFYLEAPPGFGDAEKAALLFSRATRVRPGNLYFRAWKVRTLQQIRGREAGGASELEAFEKEFGTLPGGRAMAEKLRRGEPPE